MSKELPHKLFAAITRTVEFSRGRGGRANALTILGALHKLSERDEFPEPNLPQLPLEMECYFIAPLRQAEVVVCPLT